MTGERRGADPRIAGELSSLVVHDLRNMLAVADTSAHLCEQNLDDRPFAERQIKRAREQLRRAQELATRCLAVAKGEPVEKSAMRFGELCEEALAGVSPRDGVAIEFDAASRDVELACERTLFARALANLIENARDALVDGGSVVLSIETAPAGDSIIRVRDDGPGLPAHLWLSGVTTKEAGSGLGLRVVRAIVEAHGGELSLEPCARGTTIAIQLSKPAAT